ncbi:MAG: FAD-binding protein [Elusimicrobiaceae bacterium]|nr:FAD-binding protein [Elusimicrobiaceae bacterium]
MKIKNNEILKNYTTMKIGGIAQNFYIPQNVEELITCLQTVPLPYYLLGNGSNILINDEKIFQHVIWLKEFNKTCAFQGDGSFYFGASLPIQQVINFTNEHGFGGLEYLYSVPSLLGAAIAMNAGRGKKFKKSIADYIVSVEVLDIKRMRKVIIPCEDCHFSYRNSIFKHCTERYLVLGGTFSFPKISPEESKKLKEDRMQYAKQKQDHDVPNFGSVFRVQNKYLMRLMSLPVIRSCGDCQFSSKTNNWLINKGNGTYKQICQLITRAEKLHKMFGLAIEKEIIIWE